MGATVALLWIMENRFCCLWAGDSRIYRLRGMQLERLTRDHRYVEDLLELGLVKAEDLERHPHRNVVTRAIGSELRLDLASSEGIIDAHDIFLLVTDGVSNLCDDEEVRCVLVGNAPARSVDDLFTICIARGAPDNMTAVLIAPRR
jgi:serine/threonine-protein phosphatase Stp1